MIEEMMAALMSETTPAVQLWMNWMGLVLLASVIFMWKYRPARWVFAAMIATFICVMVIWKLTENVHLFGIAHLLFWTPLAIYLWKTVLSPVARTDTRAYRIFFIWVILLVATIVISLVFDVRDIYLVFTGQK